MRAFRTIRTVAVLALVAGTLAVGSPAQGQANATDITFRFDGNALVSPGIFLPGFGQQSPTGWTWSFTSSGCDAAGVDAGSPIVDDGGNCSVSGGGDLLADLLPYPACGNSKGFSDRASFTDRTNNRTWSGEIHWDGVAEGDPSYSLGSQLYLWGEMSSPGAGTVSVQLLLNASGGQPCIPPTGGTGATSFSINGVGKIVTKVA